MKLFVKSGFIAFAFAALLMVAATPSVSGGATIEDDCEFKHGDVDRDGIQWELKDDLLALCVVVGLGEYRCEADINKDGLVNLLDVPDFVRIAEGKIR